MPSIIPLQAAYILHTRPYRDTSLILDTFTESQGRLSLIAKGVRGVHIKKSRFKGLLQAFTPLLLSWRGKSELMHLLNAEPNGLLSPFLKGKSLVCGLYLNELLLRLTYRHDPHPRLFQAYHTALHTLSKNYNLTLRLFEKKLLTELGYAIRLEQDQTYQPILPKQLYRFIPNKGFIAYLNKPLIKEALFSGETLLAIHYEQWTDTHLQEAKRLFGLALNHLLEGRNIKSRELLLKRKVY